MPGAPDCVPTAAVWQWAICLEVRPENRPRDSAARCPSCKEPTSTGMSVFDIRAVRSAGGDAADGVHGRRRSGRAFGCTSRALAQDLARRSGQSPRASVMLDALMTLAGVVHMADKKAHQAFAEYLRDQAEWRLAKNLQHSEPRNLTCAAGLDKLAVFVLSI